MHIWINFDYKSKEKEMELPIELNNGVPGGCDYWMQQRDLFEYLKILLVKEGRFSLQNWNLPLNSMALLYRIRMFKGLGILYQLFGRGLSQKTCNFLEITQNVKLWLMMASFVVLKGQCHLPGKRQCLAFTTHYQVTRPTVIYSFRF